MKRRLDSLLKNDEDIVIKRSNLLKLIESCTFNLEQEYNELKKEREKLNKKIDDLNYIKSELSLFHKETYKVQIEQIGEITKNLMGGRISEFENKKTSGEIDKLLELKREADKENKVKDLVFFQCIYEETQANSLDE